MRVGWWRKCESELTDVGKVARLRKRWIASVREMLGYRSVTAAQVEEIVYDRNVWRYYVKGLAWGAHSLSPEFSLMVGWGLKSINGTFFLFPFLAQMPANPRIGIMILCDINRQIHQFCKVKMTKKNGFALDIYAIKPEWSFLSNVFKTQWEKLINCVKSKSFFLNLRVQTLWK